MEKKGKKIEKIALLGGTFDPPHTGHLAIASLAQKELSLDRVIFIPCWISPHKTTTSPTAPEHRLRMVKLLVEGFPWAEVSTYEIDKQSPSYSWKTLEHFAAQHTRAELYWILGSDQWNVIDTWAQYENLSQLATFLVVPRAGEKPQPREGFHSYFFETEFPGRSTHIRRDIEQSWETIPPAIADYIRDNGLYR